MMRASFGYGLWLVLKLLGFVVGSFVFSYIFWWTKKLVEGKPAKKKK